MSETHSTYLYICISVDVIISIYDDKLKSLPIFIHI